MWLHYSSRDGLWADVSVARHRSVQLAFLLTVGCICHGLSLSSYSFQALLCGQSRYIQNKINPRDTLKTFVNLLKR